MADTETQMNISTSSYTAYNHMTDSLPTKTFGGPFEARKYRNHFASATVVVENATGRKWVKMHGYHDSASWVEVS
jgi:hypothetical protein